MAQSLKYPKGTIELIAGDLNSESVLGTADVVIYGSLLEEQSFPEILIKAMCFEKPIIAPDISMIRKYVCSVFYYNHHAMILFCSVLLLILDLKSPAII
jgi:hypothetical protein